MNISLFSCLFCDNFYLFLMSHCHRRPCHPLQPIHADTACCACIQQHTLILHIRDFDIMSREHTGTRLIQQVGHAGRPLRGAIFHAKHAIGGHVPVDYTAWPVVGLAAALPIIILIPPVLPALVSASRTVLHELSLVGIRTATALNMASARRTLRQIERLP